MQTYTRRKRKGSRGYTLVEVMVTLALVAALVAIVLPMLKDSRRRGHGGITTTQIRGIIQGMINYAPGNNELYPGLMMENGSIVEDKTPLPASEVSFGTDRTGYEPAYRITIMLRNNYFSPEYAISPLETNPIKVPASLSAPGNISANNLSFAMLRINNHAVPGRRMEWASTTNSKAAVVSDRNTSFWVGSLAASLYSQGGYANGNSLWRGTVGYNDNHCEFEPSNILLKTRYTEDAAPVPADDLFADDKNEAGLTGYDAGMVHQDANSYVDQW